MKTIQLYPIDALSYSSASLLHSCPRKYQIQKMLSAYEDEEEESIDLCFGKAVGVGIAARLEKKDFRLAAASAWTCFLDEEKKSSGKSFWTALEAIESAPLNFKLFNPKSAQLSSSCELGFAIKYRDIYYRGFVDAFVEDAEGVWVLENKTTSFEPAAAKYMNSFQNGGYAIALDQILKTTNYKFRYLVYGTKARKWYEFKFSFNRTHRLGWLSDLLQLLQLLTQYKEFRFPKNGNSCYVFSRECKYFNVCDLQEFALPPQSLKTEQYDFVWDLEELISQYSRSI